MTYIPYSPTLKNAMKEICFPLHNGWTGLSICSIIFQQMLFQKQSAKMFVMCLWNSRKLF